MISLYFRKLILCSIVVVRNPQGHIKLYCKGADTIIFDRLDPSCEGLMHATSEHLSASLFQMDSSALYIYVHCASALIFS